MTEAERAAPAAKRSTRAASILRERALLGGALIGVGIMAAVDEIVFHQLLQWHNFVDAETPELGIVSDGVLHALELFFLVGGFFVLADARRRDRSSARLAWSGFFLGAGVFQLWDGVVDHKLLRLHQVREGVDDLLPYDVAWIASGVALLAIGAAFAAVADRSARGR